MSRFLKQLFTKEKIFSVVFLTGILFIFFLFSSSEAVAQSQQELFDGGDGGAAQGLENPAYQPLAPLPGIDGGGEVTVAEYFSTIYKIVVSLTLVVAVVMLIYGGIQYMTSDSIGGKGGGRDTIGKAIIGIVLAVSSYALLFLIGGSGSVTVGFELPPVGFVAPPPSEQVSGLGTPEDCYDARARSASTDEKRYYCGPDVENSQEIVFKLPFPGESNESYNEPGACNQVEESDVLDIANEECRVAGGEIEELPYFYGSSDYLYGYYCFKDATAGKCANILDGEFATLDMLDTKWDEDFCDTRNVPIEGTTEEQREQFQALSNEFFDNLLIGDSYQTSGYYNDLLYTANYGGGTDMHTGIDIGTGGLPLTVRSPVSGTFFVLREPGFNGYEDNGKFAIVEDVLDPNSRIWVFTHVDNFQFVQGQPVYKGDSLASVGEEPCFPINGVPQCGAGAHLDLNIYTDMSMIHEPNNPSNWTDITSGRHDDKEEIQQKTMCPFQAYWEITSGV